MFKVLTRSEERKGFAISFSIVINHFSVAQIFIPVLDIDYEIGIYEVISVNLDSLIPVIVVHVTILLSVSLWMESSVVRKVMEGVEDATPGICEEQHVHDGRCNEERNRFH